MHASKHVARALENALLLNAWAGLFVSCDQRFFDPIILPGGKPLITLRDAALFITKLPKAEHDAEEWQAAMAALLLVAEHDGPTVFARIGVMLALNRHVERVFNPDRKDPHWGGGSWRGIDDGRSESSAGIYAPLLRPPKNVRMWMGLFLRLENGARTKTQFNGVGRLRTYITFTHSAFS
jgi:hypothetical protein